MNNYFREFNTYKFHGKYILLLPFIAIFPGMLGFPDLTMLRIGVFFAVISFLLSEELKFDSNALIWSVVIFMVTQFISVIFSTRFSQSVQYFMERLSFLFVFGITLKVFDTPGKIHYLFKTWSVITLFGCLVLILEMLTDYNVFIKLGIVVPDADYISDVSRTNLGRAVGLYSQPILSSLQILTIIPFILHLGSKKKYFYLLLCAAGIYATGTRIAIIILLFMVAYYMLSGKKSVRYQLIFLIATIILILNFGYNLYTYTVDSILLFFSGDEYLQTVGSAANINIRYLILINGLEAIKLHPYTGYGIGTLYALKASVLGAFGEFASFENTFISILLETGVIGLLSYLFMIYLSAKNGIGLIKRSNSQFVMNRTIFLSFVACFILSFTASITNFGHAFYIFGVLIALIAVGGNLSHEA